MTRLRSACGLLLALYGLVWFGLFLAFMVGTIWGGR